MSLVLFADGVEVAQVIGEGIEGTQGTVHTGVVAAGELSSGILFTTF
jgi:hypothetical protein